MPALNISLKPDAKAVSRFESRRATPSAMSSADWEKIAPAIREKCFFSARVNNAEVLGKMRELIGEAVDSAKRDPQKATMSRDKFISEMKDYLRGKGYETGGSALNGTQTHQEAPQAVRLRLSPRFRIQAQLHAQKAATSDWESLRRRPDMALNPILGCRDLS
ncbi:MAG: hypothetical protein J6P03_02500 [Opitutales bacterium]|nr:hypothetical protein [Opitutales bacterium]